MPPGRHALQSTRRASSRTAQNAVAAPRSRQRLRSLFFRQPRDNSDVLDPGFTQSIEDFVEFLQVDGPVAAQVDTLVGAVQRQLPHPLGEELDPHWLLVDEHPL